MAWPTKTNFVDGDVLTAAQVNNIGTNLNVFNPTAATNGQVWVANGTGGGAYGSAGGGMTLIQSVTLTGAQSFTISSIPTTYQNLYIRLRNVTVASAAGISLQINGITATYRTAERFASQAAVTADAWNNSTMTGNQSDVVISSFGTTSQGQAHIWIHDYASASTPRKTIYGQITRYDNSSLFRISEIMGFNWASGADAAITSVTVLAAGVNFTGGAFQVYGVK